MGPITDYLDLERYLQDRRIAQGLTWKELGKQFGKGESWMRHVCSRIKRMETDAANAGVEGMGLRGKDAAYFLALVRARYGVDWVQRADAIAHLWVHGTATTTPEGLEEDIAWLQQQPLGVWAVQALRHCTGFDGTPGEVAQILRSPSDREHCARSLADLASHGPPHPIGSPLHHVWPQRTAHHREACQRIMTAHQERGSGAKYSVCVSAAVAPDVLERLVVNAEHVAARITAFGTAPDPTSVILMQVVLAPFSVPVTVGPDVIGQPEVLAKKVKDEFDNPAEISWRRYVRQRLEELGRTQRELAEHVGMSHTWVCNLLSYRFELSQTKKPILAPMMELLDLDLDQQYELQALVEATSPDPLVRSNAIRRLEERSRLGWAINTALNVTPFDRPSWRDVVVRELALIDALPDDAATLGQTTVPPISTEDAAEALDGLGQIDTPLIATARSTNDMAHRRHTTWLQALEERLAADDPTVRAWTRVVPVPADGFDEAIKQLKDMLVQATKYEDPPTAGEATVFHLRGSVVKLTR